MTDGSQYKAARAIEDAGGHPDHPPVCFHAGAFSIGTLRRAGGTDERVIRFTLHEGKAIDVAISPALATQLAEGLTTFPDCHRRTARVTE